MKTTHVTRSARSRRVDFGLFPRVVRGRGDREWDCKQTRSATFPGKILRDAGNEISRRDRFSSFVSRQKTATRSVRTLSWGVVVWFSGNCRDISRQTLATTAVCCQCLRSVYTLPIAGMLAGMLTGRSLVFDNSNWLVTGAHRLHDASY